MYPTQFPARNPILQRARVGLALRHGDHSDSCGEIRKPWAVVLCLTRSPGSARSAGKLIVRTPAVAYEDDMIAKAVDIAQMKRMYVLTVAPSPE